MRLSLIIFFALLTACSAVKGPLGSTTKAPPDQQTLQSNYKRSSLAQLRAESTRLKAGSENDVESPIVLIAPERYMVLVRYQGQSRALSEDSSKFMEYAARSFPFVPQAQWELYTDEILVSTNEESPFWMPIQKETLMSLLPELKMGDEFEALVFWMGEYKNREMCFINAAISF